MVSSPSFPPIKWWRHKRFWRFTAVGFAVILAAYLSLFFAGMLSPHYQPDPKIEGRLLSQWADDIKGYNPLASDVSHYRAAEVIRAHKELVLPALIGWLDDRDTLSENVYLATMSWIDELHAKPPSSSAYYGAHQNHGMAARALRVIGDCDPGTIAALRRTDEYYAGTRYFVVEDIRNALAELGSSPTNAP